jgi:predicted RNA-binding protein with RPS1 domain
VEVIVVEIDQANRRIRLSAKAVTEATERGEARDYAERQQAEQSESFGSLASSLRAAMDRNKK